MNRRLAMSVLAVLMIPAAVLAQATAGVHILTNAVGARFIVDGQIHTNAVTLIWPVGSKHILEVFYRQDGYQYADSERTRYLFGGWADNTGTLQAGGSTVLTVTADPAITSYRASFSVTHQVNIQFYGPIVPVDQDGVVPPGCAAPGDISPTQLRAGIVIVAGTCLWNSTQVWMGEGTHSINAFPYPGWVFEGWIINGVGPSSFLSTFDIRAPLTLIARFSTAKRVRFLTDPPGLRLLIDRTPVPTSDTLPCSGFQTLPPTAPRGFAALCYGEFDWALKSSHVMGAISPQYDGTGKLLVFDRFSNGSGANSVYEVTSLTPETIVGRFVAGARVGFLTSPTGLKLTIDGRSNYPSYNFEWAVGSKHTVSPAVDQVDSRGRRYRFTGWSNGGPAAQEITVPEAAATDGYRLVAKFELLSQVTIQSSPAGATIEADGAACKTPCVLDRTDGTTVRVSTPEMVALSSSHRLEFAGWSDGGGPAHEVTVAGTEARTLTVNYNTAYRLQLVTEPLAGARFQLEPATTDGFYTAGTGVMITVDAAPGYRFRRWAGDLEGTSRIQFVSLSTPKQARAMLDKVPYIAPAGIRNAAGDTPDATVSPGGLISIYGENLAPHFEIGPDNPMAQTIAGVTATIGSRIVPLLFVSPQQINAQLPSALEEGSHTITVRWSGQQIAGTFRVARNAPGLFSRLVETTPFLLGFHQDGSEITLESPMRRGETATLIGSGFGPCTPEPPDGFPLPASPSYLLVDAVEIFAGDHKLETVWAGGAVGQIGTIAVRFRLTDALLGGSTMPLRVVVNGRESNRVMLAVE